MTIKKAILPIAGLGTRFLPLSKTFPKELWPLISRPVLDYIIEEVKKSGVKKIVLVISLEKKKVFQNYIRRNQKIENMLKLRGKGELLEDLKKLGRDFSGLSFSFILQNKPLGDGHAILQARKAVGREPIMVSFGDDVIVSAKPCLAQLKEIFKKYGQSVIALKRVARARIGSYGAVKAKKVGPRLYRIQGIVEKPAPGQAPSNLAIVGKYILTPQVFDYLKAAQPVFRGEIVLAETLEKMIEDGIMIYGYEFEGDWLECGNVENWLKSNLFLARKKGLKV